MTWFDERLPVRFWKKVKVDENGCWLWIGATQGTGYGVMRCPGSRLVHRIAYVSLVAEIPDGLDLDHLCRVRNCCNPTHLEPVSRKENLKRGKQPNRSHPCSDEKREKLSQVMKGKRKSFKTRVRMSAAQRARRDKERQENES